jgi:hypothetical protein
VRRLSPRLFVLVLVLVAACAAAADSTIPPAKQRPACTQRGAWFTPVPAVAYQLSVDDGLPTGSRRVPYKSTIVFTPAADGAGWNAVEDRFTGPFVAAQTGDLTGAALVWRLDRNGVPVAAPEQRGNGKREVLPNLSLFAFRPVGLVLATTCVGDGSSSTWTDSIGRVRSFRYRVTDATERRGQLHLEVAGTVKTAVNEWRIDGEVLVGDDGLTGESHLRERGPADDRGRTIRITRP